jgi:prefoldin beta subunit
VSFLNSERTESQISEIQEKLEKKKGQIIQAQSGLQAAGPAPGKAAVKA